LASNRETSLDGVVATITSYYRQNARKSHRNGQE